METQSCFLLSYLKYGDYDAILHCFTKENGFQSFFAKGIYTAKNKKKPYLYPLSLLQITTSKASNSGGISRISKMELDSDSYDFSEISMTAILFFIADFLHQVLREESANIVMFDEINSLKREISLGNSDAYLSFIFRFLKLSGLAPLNGDGKYLNPESGIFENEISHRIFNQEISDLWKTLLTISSIYSLDLKRNQRNTFLDSLIIYCQFHLDSFYTPNSLAVVRQIFD
ncbi:DNA repair protein RecO [Chryseobacterium sp. SNU WT5]|uniref:DNA repair protein RecO n=1 Tax=Chryseobacterium sp. SNU WT5 TaxID=2594269 RepID=UPI00117D4304|nr:recombination protein O N-terminal domain-containing protein [Chryseobacterium sp. SNU WT5]QDP86017.1 DNA repair protein RecO [Chryseobacterium sp. SNU WT5]